MTKSQLQFKKFIFFIISHLYRYIWPVHLEVFRKRRIHIHVQLTANKIFKCSGNQRFEPFQFNTNTCTNRSWHDFDTQRNEVHKQYTCHVYPMR